METASIGIPPAFDFSDAPPVDLCGIAVLLVARNYATLASDALRHVEIEAVLFTRLREALRNARNRRQRSNFIQAFAGPVGPGAAQHECAVAALCPFNQR
jgi:hypothetical protein